MSDTGNNKRHQNTVAEQKNDDDSFYVRIVLAVMVPLALVALGGIVAMAIVMGK